MSLALPEELITLLDLQLERNASELHIQSNTFAYLTIEGKIVKTDIFTDENILWKISETLTSDTLYYGTLIDKKSTDFAFVYKDTYRFRISIVESFNGLKLSIRNNNYPIRTFEELGFNPKIWEKPLNQDKGLILIAGSTSSGKTTTIATAISNLILKKKCIVTLEDPVEFVFNNDITSITQRELHNNFFSYADAIRDAMRMASDVIVVNELRDKDTIDATLEAAETGHLVIATVHTKDLNAIENRLILTFPANEQTLKKEILNQTLIFKVHQSLVYDSILKRLRLVYDYEDLII